VLKGLGEVTNLGHNRHIVDEVQEKVLWANATDAELFQNFVGDIWEVYNDRWGMYHDGQPLPVSKEDMIRYAYTAVKTRVSRVRGERFHLRCDDPWQLPAPLAVAINGIGRVSLEAPVVTILPQWNAEYDGFLIAEMREWHRLTERLRTIGSDQDAKIILVKALAGDRTGDENVMSLVPIRDELGRIVRLHSTHTVDAIAATVFLISGFHSAVYDAYTLRTHPQLLPPYYMEAAALAQYMWRYVDTAAA
jgi:hypothetical protein